MMHEHEEFEVETDVAGEWPKPFVTETVRWVVVESLRPTFTRGSIVVY